MAVEWLRVSSLDIRAVMGALVTMLLEVFGMGPTTLGLHIVVDDNMRSMKTAD